MRITSLSGGTEFPTIPIGEMTIRSESGNNIMFVGGVVDDSPYSGRGMDLWGGESMTLNVQNMNQIRVFAATSGQMLSVLGFGTASDVALTTNDPIFVDTTPPTITTVFPASGASNIELNEYVYITFSETMASGSQNTSGFTVRLSGSSTNVPGVVFRDVESPNIIAFDPTSNLSGSKIYIARIGTQVKDLNNNNLVSSGSWSFTTIGTPPPADVTPPTVSSHTPVSGAVNQAITISPTITFSEAIQSGSVNSTFFSVRLSGGTALPAAITLGADSKTVTINPTSDLTNSKIYRVNATSGIKDIAGNNLTAEKVFPFTTAAPTLTIVYNVTGDGTNQLFQGDDEFEAAKVVTSNSDLYNKVIKQVRVALFKVEATPGFLDGTFVHCMIVKASDNSEVLLESKPMEDIGTGSFADYTFTNTSITYALKVGDRIGIAFAPGDSDANNYLWVRRANSDVVDGTDTIRSIGAGTVTHHDSYEDQTDRDFAGIMWT